MVLLNGRYVVASEIDPCKHKFIGMFRPPVDQMAGIQGYIACSCGKLLQQVGDSFKHWHQGCYDIPQYIDI